MKKDYLKTAGKTTILYLPGRIIPAIIGFLSIPVFTRILGVEKYGDYSLILTTISVFTIFTTVWVENSTVRFYPHRDVKEISSFTKTIFLSVVFNVITFGIIFLTVALILKNSKQYSCLVNNFLWGIAAFCSISLFHSFNSIFRAKQNASRYSIDAILFALGKLILAVLFLKVIKDSVGMIFLAIFLTGMFLIPLMLNKLDIGVHLRNGNFSPKKFYEYFSFGWPFTIIMISSWILNLFNRYLLKYYLGSSAVGVYSAIFNLSSQSLSFIFMALMLAVYPILVKVWEVEGKEITAELVTKFIRYYFMLCLPVLIGLIMLSDEIINILTTKDFVSGIKIVPYIAFSSFLVGLNQYFTKPVELEKKSKLLSLLMLIAAIINVVSAFILIPKYGLKGAAISTLLAYIFLTFTNWFVGRKFLKYHMPNLAIFKISIAVACMGGIIYFLKNVLAESVLSFILILILAGSFYLFFLFLIGEIKEGEIAFFKSLFGLNFHQK
jgi:O-antigen/teichoic acid export membrane protein